jgi:hypothetical protein
MIDTLLDHFRKLRNQTLEQDRLIDRLRIYIPDGDEDYFRLIEENKKVLKTLNELIAGTQKVKERIN